VHVLKVGGFQIRFTWILEYICVVSTSCVILCPLSCRWESCHPSYYRTRWYYNHSSIHSSTYLIIPGYYLCHCFWSSWWNYGHCRVHFLNSLRVYFKSQMPSLPQESTISGISITQFEHQKIAVVCVYISMFTY